METGLALLTALAEAGRPMALADLARAAGMAPAKAHRYLVSLIRARHGRAAGAGKPLRPRAGGPVARPGGARAARPAGPDGSGAGRNCATRSTRRSASPPGANRGPTILRMEQASRSVAVNVRIGSVLSPLRSASGRVFVAWLAEARADPATAADRASLGWTEAELEHLVAGVRADGIARVEGGAAARRECGLGTGLRPRRPGGFRADGAWVTSGRFDMRTGRSPARALAAAGARLSSSVREPYPRDSRSAVGTRTEGGPRIGDPPHRLNGGAFGILTIARSTPIRPLPAPPRIRDPERPSVPRGICRCRRRLASATSSNGRTAIGR